MKHTCLFKNPPRYIIFLIQHQNKTLLSEGEYPPCLEENFSKNELGLYKVDIKKLTAKVLLKLCLKEDLKTVICKYQAEQVPKLPRVVVVFLEIVDPIRLLENFEWVDFGDNVFRSWLESINRHTEYPLFLLNPKSLPDSDKSPEKDLCTEGVVDTCDVNGNC